ncbi:MAG: class I SAM-dependent methyltransferase, partial [Anaerolineae bacterium]|nr:class I SAM-dependent methyltransferase [Anaerolineae bacterium]
SGPEGLALFWRGPVTGVDLAFKRRPLHQAVRASALALPFQDRSWPAVVSCDMLEHLAPVSRSQAVMEIARVARESVFLAFPSGPAAETCYADLARRLHPRVPGWLADHLVHGLPDAAEVAGWLRSQGWSVKVSWHESVATHMQLVAYESRWLIGALSYGLTRLVGPWLAPRLPINSEGPLLRALLIAERSSSNMMDR